MEEVISKLKHLIEAKRSEILEKQRQINELEAEIKGYESAIATISGIGVPKLRAVSEQSLPALSDTWQKILSFVGGKESGGASIDEIEDFIIVNKLEVNRNTVRSQLSNYNSKGILRRVATSQYELTGIGLMSLSAAHRNARTNQMTESMTPVGRLRVYDLARRTLAEAQNSRASTGESLEHLLRESPVHKHGRPIDDD